MILLTEYFISDNIKRQKEYEICLENNIKNEFITNIVLFNSDKSYFNFNSDKISMVYLEKRPNYIDIFNYCNENFKDEICIISNADIIFDDSLKHINKENIKGKFLALSRWDIIEQNKAQLYDWSYSQDCWIYLAPHDFKDAKYTMGRLGCDNRIAFDAKASGLDVTNPAKLIKTFHLHTSNHRTYKQHDILMGDFMFVEANDSMDEISDHIVCEPRTLNQTVQFVQRKKMSNKKFDKLISYSFFTPKKIYQHRFWDKTNNLDRYWYNIPILMAVNKIIYPDFDILIQISPDIQKDFKYEILEKLSKEFGIKIEVNDSPYNETEPTVWRYKPLFNKECNILLCRDIDSLPTYSEYLATKDFIISDKNLHTIRSHTNHTTGATIILAGLCGFKPNNIPFINFNFEQYYQAVSRLGWGLDQSSLIQIFNKPNWTKANFIDSALSSNSHKVGNPILPCTSKTEKDYNSLNEYCDIFNIINNYVEWPGEPVDFRKDKLIKLLDIDYLEFRKLKEILYNSNEKIKEFYL
jgi:hypothetical protein